MLDLVAHLPDIADGQTFWIAQRPILSAETWNVGTFLAASHRHKEACVTRQGFCKELRLRGGKIEANFAHHFLHFGVNTRPRLRPAEMARALAGSAISLKKAVAICDRPAL